jgi:hypothetical protein
MKVEIKDNIYVQLNKGNLRGFTLVTNSTNIVEKRGDNYEILSLIIEDKYRLKTGDIIDVEDVSYTVNKIRKGSESYYYLIQEKATKVSHFIMPILGYDYSYFDFKETFYNSYISDDYNSIFLVYKFNNSKEYLQLEDRLQQHLFFLRMLDPDPNTVVFEFKIDERYRNDIFLVMKGKYSDITTTLKSKICTFHKFSTQSKTFRLLYRDKTLREDMSNEYGFDIPEDWELMSKPIIKEELWSYQNILKKDGIVV